MDSLPFFGAAMNILSLIDGVVKTVKSFHGGIPVRCSCFCWPNRASGCVKGCCNAEVVASATASDFDPGEMASKDAE